ncbi:Uncharacterised protein [Legionella beliardensis]|uniref:Uncharacterized protein n=1 Tax=Legionella beliardensis TaxID=91822 RepID=A0A378JPC8_9GAMM|nr:Uncharacterised protein [Legionella beliardensis]
MDKESAPDLEIYQTKSKDTLEAKAAQLLKPICYLENFLNADDLPQIDFSWTTYLYIGSVDKSRKASSME